MPRIDLPASELRACAPVITEPADLGEFWSQSLADARDIPPAVRFDPVDTCPPASVYAADNAYGGPKEIRDYQFNDHEGGQIFQKVEQLTRLASIGLAS